MRPARAVASPRRARSARKAAAFLLAAAATLAAAFDLAPPETPVGAVVESFHGELVVDPYRWLEDTGSPATREWFEAQDAHARSVLGALPGRAALRGEIASLLSANASVHDVRRGGTRARRRGPRGGRRARRLRAARPTP